MYQPAYAAPRPPSHRVATAVNRTLAVLAAGFFTLVVRHVLAHDDPHPGLSPRGWLTIALAAVLILLLRAHRRHRGYSKRAPLGGAVAELGAALLLGALLATAPATAPAKVAAPATDERPALVGVVADARGWLAELKRQVDQGTAPPPTTTPRRSP